MSETGTTKRRLGEGLENDRTDWERVNARSDADIAEAIRNDPDAVDPGEEWLHTAQAQHPDQTHAEQGSVMTTRSETDLWIAPAWCWPSRR